MRGQNQALSLSRDAHVQVLECAWRLMGARRWRRRWWQLWRPALPPAQGWQWRFVVRNPQEYPILFTVRFELHTDRGQELDAGRFGQFRYADDPTRERLLLRHYQPHFAQQIIGPGQARVFAGFSEYDPRDERDLGVPARLVWTCVTARLY
jgi:hypothetical protein